MASEYLLSNFKIVYLKIHKSHNIKINYLIINCKSRCFVHIIKAEGVGRRTGISLALRTHFILNIINQNKNFNNNKLINSAIYLIYFYITYINNVHIFLYNVYINNNYYIL